MKIKEFHSNENKILLISKLEKLEKLIGNTPIVSLRKIKGLHVKLESYQFANSIKIRPAFYIIKKAILNDSLKKDHTIIESSSGNFGIALALIAKYIGIKFIAVVDTYTPPNKVKLLQFLATEVVIISEKDKYGGYLLNRIAYIQTYKEANSNCFHPDQYNNPDNPESYFHGLGEEISRNFDNLDAIFVSVSTCGTISGLSKKLRLKFPNIYIIAVDIEGSLIFQSNPHNRTLSGIGSSLTSSHLDKGLINGNILLSEDEIINGCKELLNHEIIFGGASTGAAYIAAKTYIKKNPNKTVLFISPDSGESYLDSVYLK